MDIAIINTLIITFEGKGLGIIKAGGLGFEDGKISYVGKMSEFEYKNADLIIDGNNKHATLPGLINAHIHSPLTICRGVVHDIPEGEYMFKGLSPFINQLRSEDSVLGTKLTVIEGIRSGTTTFAEYEGNVRNLVEKVYLPYNIRVVATETINERVHVNIHKPSELYEFNRSKGEESLKRANELFKKFKNNDLVTPMYGPQALDMLTMDFLKEIKQQAISNESKTYMHIAQGARERQQITKRYGKDMTAVKLLKANDLLDTTLIAAHIHDTTTEERNLMVKNNVKMVGCPSAISKVDGIAPPLGDYIRLGGLAGIGTDEAPGSGHHNLFHEIKLASIFAKIAFQDPTILPPWESLKLATISGAEVLGIEDQIGSLKIGKRADVITIDLHQPHLIPIINTPFHNILANLVYSSKGNEIDNVIIHGKPILLNNEFVEIDETSIINEVNNRAQEICENASEDWEKSNSKMVEYHKSGFI
ncbi:MAG: amidohydrolase family protein [Candidatus Lokiarchaeota archaeon]|nr:amidohydrolase family protein [Candidatus Lokiarchaeota archaeon]